MRVSFLKKEMLFGIVILLLSTTILPALSGEHLQPTAEQIPGTTPRTSTVSSEKTTMITFYLVEKTTLTKHSVVVTVQDAKRITSQFQTLTRQIAAHPYEKITQLLETQFIALLMETHVVPAGVTPQQLTTLLTRPVPRGHPAMKQVFPSQGTHSEWFCNFATTGEGTARPIIILPRFIPFILTPIPRAFVSWKTPDGITSVGGLRSQKGFIAGGSQNGIALGFWGIGFSIFLPPINAYGIFGYAVYAKVTADQFEFWPPNHPPTITQTDPADGEQNVNLDTSKLQFSIDDADNDLLSYNVTTTPDIGSGSGGLKPSGIYSIPISGLESFTTYTWHIQMTDGKDTGEKTLRFTTVQVAPMITQPSPADDERHVPTDLQQLQFTLQDHQGDAMAYTVETSPFIGAGSGTNVHNGTCIVAVSGLQNFTTYHWYVNATDGTYWTRKTFAFETSFPTQYDPFDHGWHYRKQVTISHTTIPEALTDFPVLVGITDTDLKNKAQASGDDILFMNATGVATRLNYEIEQYDGTTGALVAWVNVSHLSSDTDTTFYLYYGNPTSLSQQDPEHTWDAHYVAVWHCGETQGLYVADSTAHHYNGTANDYTPVVSGRLGKGRYFDMTNSEIYVGAQTAFGGMTSYTVEAWATPKSISGEHRIFDRSGQSNPNTILFYQNNAVSYLTTNNVDSSGYTDAFTVDSWTHTVGVFTGSGGESAVYYNGVKGIPITTTQANPTAGSFTIYIGRACLSSSSSYRWYGTLDEIRFSNIARSPAWISVSYHNQENPADFLSIGPEVPGI